MIESDKSKMVLGTIVSRCALNDLNAHDVQFIVSANELDSLLEHGLISLESLEKEVQYRTIYCISHAYLEDSQAEITIKAKGA